MESMSKEPRKGIKWLTRKIRNHRIQRKAENGPPHFQSERTRTETLPLRYDSGHVQENTISINAQAVNQVSIEDPTVVEEDVPNKNESSSTGQLVPSTQHSGEHPSIQNVMSEPHSTPQAATRFKRNKPPPPPQIPSTPAADQAAHRILLSSGFRLTSRTSAKVLGRALLWAIESKKSEAVRLLLNKGASTDINDGSFETLVHRAASIGDVDVFKMLLHRQFDLESKRPDGHTALHIATARSHGSIVNILLQAGADPSATTPDGRNALHFAVENKAFSLITILVKHGSNIDTPDRDGLTPLHIAAMNNDSPLIRTLLRNGADITKCTPQGVTALDIALGSQSEDAITDFLKNGAQIELCIPGGGPLMPQTIDKHGIYTIVKLAMAQHLQAVAASSGTTVLHIAAERGYTAVIGLLLDNGFDITATDDSGYTALHFACCRPDNRTNVAKLLLSRGADPLTKCKSGSTPLHMVAEQGDLELTKTILAPLPASPEAGGNVRTDIQDLEGRTPMYLAIANGHIDVVRLFIAKNANHMIRDRHGKSAPSRAGDRNYWKVLELLRLYEAKIAREARARIPVPYESQLSIWDQLERMEKRDKMFLRYD